MMEFTTILFKVISPVISILIKIFFNREKVQSFEFHEKVFENENWKNMHDYALEDAFYHRRGKEYDASVIRYLLSFPDPRRLFRHFDAGVGSLEISTVYDGSKNVVGAIALKNSLKDEKVFKKRVRKYSILFALLFLLGSFPWIFLPNLFNGFQVKTVLVMLLWMVFCYIYMHFISKIMRRHLKVLKK